VRANQQATVTLGELGPGPGSLAQVEKRLSYHVSKRVNQGALASALRSESEGLQSS